MDLLFETWGFNLQNCKRLDLYHILLPLIDTFTHCCMYLPCTLLVFFLYRFYHSVWAKMGFCLSSFHTADAFLRHRFDLIWFGSKWTSVSFLLLQADGECKCDKWCVTWNGRSETESNRRGCRVKTLCNGTQLGFEENNRDDTCNTVCSPKIKEYTCTSLCMCWVLDLTHMSSLLLRALKYTLLTFYQNL